METKDKQNMKRLNKSGAAAACVCAVVCCAVLLCSMFDVNN